jgi:hypothetical protein
MLRSRTRLLAALTVSVVLAALGALSGVSRGAEPPDQVLKSLKPGEYDGLWHGNKVKFIFDKVKDGTFTGVARFAKGTPYPDQTMAFTGKLSDDGSITIQRDIKDIDQKSEAPKPAVKKGHLIWEGQTTGMGLDAKTKYPFELHVPVAK